MEILNLDSEEAVFLHPPMQHSVPRLGRPMLRPASSRPLLRPVPAATGGGGGGGGGGGRKRRFRRKKRLFPFRSSFFYLSNFLDKLKLSVNHFQTNYMLQASKTVPLRQQ